MEETISIPKGRYEYLVHCEKLVDSEFEDRFSKKFIEDVKKSEKNIKGGKFKKFNTLEEAKSFCDSL